ncbi:sugar phosphate permease [Roseimicrobium gellanilyticum]|uniref:Sugar phosphate permease n=1 Tax=Roseimicrobium gellanilyticum TaxID=748857 RepID=A0A366HAS6_9BACT|nr:MFS transporter [Roseimicrobium gellanilyticum]RBP39009.1 sugar phosphate permease [Roseimicrobium gellanilyticum]
MRPTSVRHSVLFATTLTAFLMYLDRACLAWMLDSDSFKNDLHLTPDQNSHIKSAFFWAYALAQVPAGWLAERFGKRTLMTILIVTWSAFTALTGFANGIWMLLLARIGCGLAEAGAYPISGSLLSRWAHLNWRGFSSGVVSLGGRLGFVLAPLITVSIIVGTGNWRWAGWIYGLTGIIVALVFWWTFRETPETHPRCNEAERALLNEGRNAPTEDSSAPRRSFPWRAVLTDRSLWLMCAYQMLTNFGWAFVINSMSTYLRDVRKLSDEMNGYISTLTLFIGLFGLLLGGLLTDWLTRRFGLRLGRLIPLSVTRFVSAAMCIACLWVQNPWLLAVCLGLMVFSTDSGLPAVWAWAQDVGGRNVAPIFGWANMWGNFGAALQANLAGWLLATFDKNGDQNELFIACAIAFTLAGFLSFGINASKKVEGA